MSDTLAVGTAPETTEWLGDRGIKLSTDLGVAEALGHAVMWAIAIVFTFGFALMIFPYSFSKYALNKTYIAQDGRRIARFNCELDIASQVGHALIWFVLSVFTFGVALVVYMYKVQAYVLEHTRVVRL